MKKIILTGLIFTALFCFASCKATTATDKPSDYVYGINEEIRIIDIDSKGELGTVKITGVVILKNEPFETNEKKGNDENGNPVYEKIQYEQLIQVNYISSVTDSTKSISKANFTISDSKKATAAVDPEVEYKSIETSDKFLVAALKNKSDFVNINFKFYYWQSGVTARIKADLNEQAGMPSQSYSQPPISDEPSSANSAEKGASLASVIFAIIIGFCVLLAVVIALAITIFIFVVKKKK